MGQYDEDAAHLIFPGHLASQACTRRLPPPWGAFPAPSDPSPLPAPYPGSLFPSSTRPGVDVKNRTSWQPGQVVGAPGSRPGTGQRNPQLRRLRALQIVSERVYGATLKDIAKKFNISEKTVAAELQYATRNGLIESAEERILNELVPLALETYKRALSGDTPDVFVAKDVLGQLAKISDRATSSKQHQEKLTLAAYLEHKRLQSGGNSSDTEVIDAESVEPGASGECVSGSLPAVCPSPADDAPADGESDHEDLRPAGAGFVSTDEYLRPSRV